MEIQWTLVLFTALGGTGAWLFASAALGELLNKEKEPSKVEAIVSFILLVIGGLLSVMHLKHPDRILEALNRPTSGIFIEAALIGIICVVIAIYFIMVMRGSSPKARKVVAAIALVLGIVFSYACGSSYQMDARPAWATISLPLAYFGTAAAAGTALNLLIKVALKREAESIRFAGMVALIGGILGVLTAAIFCFSSGGEIFTAQNDLSLWLIVLFLSLIVACVCSAFAIKQADKGIVLAVVAVAGGLIAAISLRVVMWLIGTPIMDIFMMPMH